MKFAAFLKSGFCIIMLLLAVTVFAAAQKRTHTVKQGETLFSIAQQYDIDVQQLKKWNTLQSNELSLGQSLIIAGSLPANADTHTVQSHETLFSISKQYNVTISELKSWNNLTNNTLKIGQRLTVYPKKRSRRQQQSISVERETQQNTYYTVKSGDTIFKIAKDHGMEIEELKSLNDLSTNNISVGQRLTVSGNIVSAAPAQITESSPQGKFVDYTISTSATSLQELLPEFKMDEEEFRALNPGIQSKRLRAGQHVTMLAPPTRKYQNPYLENANMKDLGTTPVSEYSTNKKTVPTTTGELYNPDALTAAHPNIALGSVIFIKNPQSEKGTFVRVNDRSSVQGLKLSAAAWQTLQFTGSSPKVTIYQVQ